jgi:hypothetical protein
VIPAHTPRRCFEIALRYVLLKQLDLMNVRIAVVVDGQLAHDTLAYLLTHDDLVLPGSTPGCVDRSIWH